MDFPLRESPFRLFDFILYERVLRKKDTRIDAFHILLRETDFCHVVSLINNVYYPSSLGYVAVGVNVPNSRLLWITPERSPH